jgi:hypothetical protein
LLGYDGVAIWHSPVSSGIRDGLFELRGLERGEHRLELGDPESFWTFVDPSEAPFVVSAPATNVLFDPLDSQVWIDVRNARTRERLAASVRVQVGSGMIRHDEVGASCWLHVKPDELYRITVSADGFGSREIEVIGPAPGAFEERTVELQPVAVGSLQLVLGEERWSGSGRVMLMRRDSSESHGWRAVEFAEGRVRLDDLPPGEYHGQLALWNAGVLQGRAEQAAVLLSFDNARVEAGQVYSQVLELR